MQKIWIQAQLCAFSALWGWASLRHLQKGYSHPWLFSSIVWRLYDITDVLVSMHCKLLYRYMRFSLVQSKLSQGGPIQFLDKLTEEKYISQIWQSGAAANWDIQRPGPEDTKDSKQKASHRTPCFFVPVTWVSGGTWDLFIPTMWNTFPFTGSALSVRRSHYLAENKGHERSQTAGRTSRSQSQLNICGISVNYKDGRKYRHINDKNN